VDQRFDLVDLPGYGYARVSKQQRARWWEQFRQFLAAAEGPAGVLHLVDARHAPSEQDREVSRWILGSGRPFAVVVTKVDKVGSPRRLARYREIIAALELPLQTPFLPTSAREGQGREEVLGWIDAVLSPPVAGV
jgi:GTP-binding protein